MTCISVTKTPKMLPGSFGFMLSLYTVNEHPCIPQIHGQIFSVLGLPKLKVHGLNVKTYNLLYVFTFNHQVCCYW